MFACVQYGCNTWFLIVHYTRIDGTDAQQGPVRNGGKVVCSHGRDRLRVEVPVMQHLRGKLCQVAPMALVAVQSAIVLAFPGSLHWKILFLLTATICGASRESSS